MISMLEMHFTAILGHITIVTLYSIFKQRNIELDQPTTNFEVIYSCLHLHSVKIVYRIPFTCISICTIFNFKIAIGVTKYSIFVSIISNK